MKKTLVLILGLIVVLGAVPAMADVKFTIDLYETVDNTPTGTPTETPPAVNLPYGSGWGFVFIWEDAAKSELSDILWFPKAADGWAHTVQLFSDPAFDVPLAAYQASLDAGITPPRADILETIPPTIYEATCTICQNTGIYRVYSDFPDAPVPSSLLLLGSALLGLIGLRSKM